MLFAFGKSRKFTAAKAIKKYQVGTRLSSKKSVIIVGGSFAGDLAGNRMRESW
jgi:hypothetical protein